MTPHKFYFRDTDRSGANLEINPSASGLKGPKTHFLNKLLDVNSLFADKVKTALDYSLS